MSKLLISAPIFIRRVIAHEATRQGAASAAAGVLVAVILESIWPTA